MAKVAAKSAVYGAQRKKRASLSPRKPTLPTLLESLPFALLGVDGEGRISDYYPGAQHFLTLPPESILDRPFGAVLADLAKRQNAPGLRGLVALISAALEGGEPPIGWHFEYFQGEEAFLLRADFAVHKRNGGERAVGGALILQNVGDRHKAVEQTRELDYMASLDQTAASIVHELRNPLSTVKAAAQMLSDGGVGEEEMGRYARMINREADRMERLAADFLAYARFPHLTYGPVSPERLLDESQEMLRRHAEKREITIVGERGNLPGVIDADGEALVQAIVNIGKNAIEAIPERGIVTLEAKSGRRTINLTISDNGCGISRKNREQIFDAFYTTKPNGTGLGLCIARKIVEAHEGEMKVSSVLGRGTKVSMKIPCRKRAVHK